MPDATPELRQEAAEAYRRLAIVQNSTERPSLRDRPAARASLEKALGAGGRRTLGCRRQLRARILIDAARQAAADGRWKGVADAGRQRPIAPAMRRRRCAMNCCWRSRDRRLAGRISDGPLRWPSGWRRRSPRRCRGCAPPGARLDLAAEGHYYAGNKPAALAEYQAAAAAARAGLAAGRTSRASAGRCSASNGMSGRR